MRLSQKRFLCSTSFNFSNHNDICMYGKSSLQMKELQYITKSNENVTNLNGCDDKNFMKSNFFYIFVKIKFEM